MKKVTLQGTNISPKNGILKMIFLFPRWDMLIPWRVHLFFHVHFPPLRSCPQATVAESSDTSTKGGATSRQEGGALREAPAFLEDTAVINGVLSHLPIL